MRESEKERESCMKETLLREGAEEGREMCEGVWYFVKKRAKGRAKKK